MVAAITFGGAVAAIATETNAADRYISDAVIYEPDTMPECDRRELDHVVIEKVIGVCLDSEGNGQILNTRNTEFNYIYYGNDDIQPGDVVMSLLTYNPDTNYDDDIVSREDFVIDAGVEVGEEE
jgi:hypothetical protein